MKNSIKLFNQVSLVLIFMLAFLVSSCSSTGESAVSTKLVADAMSAVPIVNGQRANYGIYIKNLSSQNISGITYSIDAGAAGENLPGTTMNVGNCDSIAANSSCKINFVSSKPGAFVVSGNLAGKSVLKFVVSTYSLSVSTNGSPKNALVVNSSLDTLVTHQNSGSGIANSYYGSVDLAILNTYNKSVDITNLFGVLPTNVKWSPINCPNPLPAYGVCQFRLVYSGGIGSDVAVNLHPTGKIADQELPVQNSSEIITITKNTIPVLNLSYSSMVLDGKTPNNGNKVTNFIENVGVQTAVLSNLKIIDSNSTELFSVSSNNCKGVLAPGDVCEYTVTANVGALSSAASGEYGSNTSIDYHDSLVDRVGSARTVYKYTAKSPVGSEGNLGSVIIDGIFPKTLLLGNEATVDLHVSNKTSDTVTVKEDGITASLEATGLSGTLTTTGINNGCNLSNKVLILQSKSECHVNLELIAQQQHAERFVNYTILPPYYVSGNESGNVAGPVGVLHEITHSPALALAFYKNGALTKEITNLSAMVADNDSVPATAVLQMRNVGNVALNAVQFPSINGFTFTPDQSCQTLAVGGVCNIVVSLASSSPISPTIINTDPDSRINYDYGSGNTNGAATLPALEYQVSTHPIEVTTHFVNCGDGESDTAKQCNINAGGSGQGTVGGYELVVTYSNVAVGDKGREVDNFKVIPNTDPIATGYSQAVMNNCNGVTLPIDNGSCTVVYKLENAATSADIDFGTKLGTYSYGAASKYLVKEYNNQQIAVSVVEPSLNISLTNSTVPTTLEATISNWYANAIPTNVLVKSSNPAVIADATVACATNGNGCNGTVEIANGLATGTAELSSSITAPNGVLLTSRILPIAVSITILHSFGHGNDGSQPYAALIEGRDGKLYGTTNVGGGVGCGNPLGGGTVFVLDPSNGAESVIHSFASGEACYPRSALHEDGNGNLYGTTSSGIANQGGVLFKIDQTMNFSIMHSFGGNNDGNEPRAIILGPGGSIYGVTGGGGSYNAGTLYRFLPNINEEEVLFSFDGYNGNLPAGLILAADNYLYGVTTGGGDWYSACGDYAGCGVVYKMSESGVQTVLHRFHGARGDGTNSKAALIEGRDGRFYGTTLNGGAHSLGTVFVISADGTESVVYSFAGGNDGANPQAALIQDENGKFYSTTANGGAYGLGTVFVINADGTESVVHSFAGGNDGSNPNAALLLMNGNLYGTTPGGGTYRNGTAFMLPVK